MQNKGAIRLFAILLALSCLYYLSFTWVTRNVESGAEEYATSYVAKASVLEAAKKAAMGDAAAEKQYLDSTFNKVQDRYLDSMKNEVVINLIGLKKFTYAEAKEHEINLGLDLRGGMNVTLEVSVADIIRNLANNNTEPAFNTALTNASKRQQKENKDFVSLFADEYKKANPNGRLAPLFQTIELKGQIAYNATDAEVLKLIRERVDGAIETTEKTLRTRIDRFGVTQPNIQKLESSGRILVELPGVKDKERVRKLLQGTANLEFWETYENAEIAPLFEEANRRIKNLNESNTEPASTPLLGSADSAKVDSSAVAAVVNDTTKVASASLDEQLKGSKSTEKINTPAGSDTSLAARQKEMPLYAVLQPSIFQQNNSAFYAPGPVVGYSRAADTAKVNYYLTHPSVKSLFPTKARFLWSHKAAKNSDVYQLVAIKVTRPDGKAALSGDIITEASKVYDQASGGSPQISMTMTSEAAQQWRRLTRENAPQGNKPGRSIAIVLDNSVYSFPTVQGEISGGQSSITGDFDNNEADDLVTTLSAGKFPAPAHIVEETVVGPTLGKESIKSGLLSFVIALALVLVFMVVYYSKAGWVADLALFANVFFVMGVLASLGAVLTLPGIAGLVLTIGMSVDANILIFERIREELAAGKGYALAIKDGFSHALSSIVDSNITTLIMGIILYVFGTGPIQGFATTLIIGILCSLFCALFISRMIFEALLHRNKVLSFSTQLSQNAFKNLNINFVGNRKKYYLVSLAIIALGAFFFVKNKGFNLGVDFKGGRTYVVRYDKDITTDQAREALTASLGGAPEVKTYGESNQHKITTTYLIDDASEDAQEKAEAKLVEGLNKTGVKFQILETKKVGETISRDIKSKAAMAILFSCLVMFGFILLRFKKWQYGLGAVIALLHDVLIVLSCYLIFDGLLPFSLEIDQHFIAAILTVMGYSMTDTVVVFDRIREYLSQKGKSDLDDHEKEGIINYALNSTLSRTVNTSLTIFFVLLAIFVFGGETIKGFAFALLIGIVIGTYSSICIATPIVIDLDKGDTTPEPKK